ncbi:MAG TPA: zinc ribbon domain-containing protein [Candidatus Ozemobacteraceae bacterium]|nr:zinc ribbon domain-containing protein [Candidatus Ozemobacteraceae bacterium]
MTSVTLPRKVTEKLQEIPLRGEISYSFASSSSGEGMIGESWLLLTQTQIIVVVQPLVEDLKVAGVFKIQELSQIAVRRTFLGDIRFSFVNAAEAVLAEFEVPSLQKDEGEELFQMLEKRFPGKMRQTREDVLDAVDVTGDSMMTVRVDLMKSIADTTSGVQVDNVSIDSRMSLPGLDSVEGPLGDGVEQTVIIDVPVSQTVEVNTDSSVANPLSHTREHEQQKSHHAPSVNLKGPKKPKKSGQVVPPPPAPGPAEDDDASVDCTKCGRTNRVSFQYCLACGHQLPVPPDKHRRRRPVNAVVGASTGENAPDDSGCGSCLGQLIGFIIFLFIFQGILSAVFK